MKAMKKPVVLDFYFTSSGEVVNTLEGLVTAPPGAAILTGTKGEKWPIPEAAFKGTYEFDVALGKCSKKPMVVEVERMSEAFEVQVSWSSAKLTGKAGDYRVQYGPDDFGIVDADVFAETYNCVDPNEALEEEEDSEVACRPTMG